MALAANTTYYLAEDFGTATRLDDGARLISNPFITYGGAVLALGQGLDPTTDLDNGIFNPAYFGPDFDIASTSTSVPEPWTLALFGTGLAGLLMLRRRIVKNAKAV